MKGPERGPGRRVSKQGCEWERSRPEDKVDSPGRERGCSRWLSGEESAWQSRSHRGPGFNPWVGKDPLEEEMAIFLPGESHGQRSLVVYSPGGAQRGRRDCVTAHTDSRE